MVLGIVGKELLVAARYLTVAAAIAVVVVAAPIAIAAARHNNGGVSCTKEHAQHTINTIIHNSSPCCTFLCIMVCKCKLELVPTL